MRTGLGQTNYDIIVAYFLGQSSRYMDSMNLSEWHLYGSSRIGIYQTSINMAYRNIKIIGGVTTDSTSATVAMPSYTLFDIQRGAKRYELSNHLGNVLVVVSDKKIQTCSTSVVTGYFADVVNANDYSAFGAPLASRSYSAPNTKYRFGFNGKETDTETQTQDYGMRIYDYRVGRFLSTDPLTKSYPMLTPYQFASNTPIMAIDLDGCEAEVVIYGTGGPGTAYHDGHELSDGTRTPPDGKYIMNCGVAGANRMGGVKAKPVTTGKHLLGILTSETIKKEYIASMVYYGHSGVYGLFLYNSEGFYDGNDFARGVAGLGASDLRLLADFSEKGLIKIGKSSTFVFASCLTMARQVDNVSFGGSFSDAISKGFRLDEKKTEEFFSITVVGATELVNIKPDGTAYCENGTFISKTTTYKAEREFKDVTLLGIKIGTKATGSTKITKVSETEKDLGKTIDPASLTN